MGFGRAFKAAHGFFEHFKVQIKPHTAHVARLHFAKNIARAAQAQVFHGNLKTRAQIVHIQNDAQALLGNGGKALGIGHDKKGIGLPVAAAHTATQLIELPKAKHLRLIHHQGVGTGKIQPGFNNGSAHQHIKLAVPEFVHGVFELGFRHLPVGHAHAGRGHKCAHVF